jgi:hypothetical protein
VVTDRVKNDQGGIVETTLPACADAGDAAPCWSLEDGAARCPGRRVLKVNRERDPAPVNRSTEISCAVAPAGDVVGPTTCSR